MDYNFITITVSLFLYCQLPVADHTLDLFIPNLLKQFLFRIPIYIFKLPVVVPQDSLFNAVSFVVDTKIKVLSSYKEKVVVVLPHWGGWVESKIISSKGPKV